jgi:hypothetical protein
LLAFAGVAFYGSGLAIPAAKPAARFSVRDISAFEFDERAGSVADVPLRFRSLHGQRVELVGNVVPPNPGSDESSNFRLTYFEPHRRPTVPSFVACRVEAPVPHAPGEVRVAGMLHVRVVRRDDRVESVFSLDVDSIEASTEGKPSAD